MQASKPVPREAVLVVNARSRKGERLFRHAHRLLEAAGVKLIAAHAVKDPSKLNDTVRKAVADGAPMVIIGGGDGSLSCAVDYLVDRDCVFALLPLGTANSFARTLGIPLDLEGAIQTIANGRRRRIDLGVIDGDYFANTAAIGLASTIGTTIPAGFKRHFGRAGYLLWAVWTLLKFRPFALTLEYGDESRTLVALEVRIANGRFHGGVEIVETTDVDSGDIVVQVVPGRTRMWLAWNWLATVFRLPWRHQTSFEVRGQRLQVITRPPLTISIDGELLGKTPATVEVAQCAIEVVVPA